jgi:hypothetical protein
MASMALGGNPVTPNDQKKEKKKKDLALRGGLATLKSHGVASFNFLVFF